MSAIPDKRLLPFLAALIALGAGCQTHRRSTEQQDAVLLQYIDEQGRVAIADARQLRDEAEHAVAAARRELAEAKAELQVAREEHDVALAKLRKAKVGHADTVIVADASESPRSEARVDPASMDPDEWEARLGIAAADDRIAWRKRAIEAAERQLAVLQARQDLAETKIRQAKAQALRRAGRLDDEQRAIDEVEHEIRCAETEIRVRETRLEAARNEEALAQARAEMPIETRRQNQRDAEARLAAQQREAEQRLAAQRREAEQRAAAQREETGQRLAAQREEAEQRAAVERQEAEARLAAERREAEQHAAAPAREPAPPEAAAETGKTSPPPLPDPRQKEHHALQSLAGTWDCVVRTEAMRGVPGMETATESTATENAELLGNGLWLKSTVNGTRHGQPFQGVWLAGYDPFRREYTGLWVCSDENDAELCTRTGIWDETTRTWIWRGRTPHGQMRSVAVLQSPDTIVETCYLKGADGWETKCMEITRRRSRAPATADADWSTSVPAEVEPMHGDIGTWDATICCTAPGGTAAGEWQGTERVAAIAGGRWLWSDCRGASPSGPFEGHHLVGYDPGQKKIVSIWIDSRSPVWLRTEGDGAPEGELVLSGTGTDAAGRPTQVRQVLGRADDATRTRRMECECADGTSTMVVTCRRRDRP